MNILVAIPTYKRLDFLPDCIEAVMRQTVTNATLTVLMVDNAPDQSAKPFYDQYPPTPYPFIYLHQPEKGLSNARNMAIEYAISEISDALLYVDDDMRLPPDYLQQQIDAMKKHGADAVRGIMQTVDEQGQPLNKARWRGFSHWREMLAGNGVLIARKIYSKMELRFDSRYTFDFEDGDFFYRSYIKGAKLYQTDTLFNELRKSDRRQPVDRKTELMRLARTRQKHVQIRKNNGGIWRALWYVIKRIIFTALPMLPLLLLLPIKPHKSWKKLQNKFYQINGLVKGLIMPHSFN